jgi:hypothetical protein
MKKEVVGTIIEYTFTALFLGVLIYYKVWILLAFLAGAWCRKYIQEAKDK